MITPTEHKSVQQRILDYAVEIGWSFVSQSESEKRRKFSTESISPKEKAKDASLYYQDVLFSKIKEFNPDYEGTVEDIIRKFTFLRPDVYGNRDFLNYLREQQKYYHTKDKREYDLKLIDYTDYSKNNLEVTEEFYYYNGKFANREDIVFLINGIPVLVIECKNSTKDEAIALGIDQIRRYHNETPELFIPQQIFTATESIGFSYGVSWNTIRRNIFNWKDDEIGNLEKKVKSFCSIKNILDYLEKFIIFAEKDEELNKFILKQHQKKAVKLVVERSLDSTKRRALIWHTQGSGKTFTMIKVAELLFKAPETNKPTIIMMIDRNELEDQMQKNLASLGIANVEHAGSIESLKKLLIDDYRGIILTTIHKFRDMPPNINTRENIITLIDEAHRTTQGDLGTYLMAGLPNATYIGFTGTPIDKTVYGKGTFKTFGTDDKSGYLHKYSIKESIEDKTTLPLFYQIAPNEFVVPKKILEEEFYKLADEHGVNDIDELNKILDIAVNTKNFLKGKERIQKVAKFVSEHYTQNVEPLGYKAFLVAVDREACAFYKEALDRHLPKHYSDVIYTANNNDQKHLKKFHYEKKQERDIRKRFTKIEKFPKILIVTEKLLTGFDAPLLYAMYLDKPMKDHTLLQAIARVNRPYENELENMIKPHGFVLDFVGIFENLEKALAFDSDEVNSIIKDIQLLKTLFSSKMEKVAPIYIKLIQNNFTDKDTDNLIGYFREKNRRKEFFKEFKEIEMLYEIISPDLFLRPFINDYKTLSAIYAIVRNAYAKRVYVDKEFQSKTNQLIQENIGVYSVDSSNEFVEINEKVVQKIKDSKQSDNVKIINLIKTIEKTAEEQSGDPILIGMMERAESIKENWEDRQTNTQQTLDELVKLLESDIERQKEQAKKGFDGLTFFVYRTLLDHKISNSDNVTKTIKQGFIDYPNWKSSDNELRELRKSVYYAILTEEEDINKAADIVEELFNLLFKAYDL